MKIAHKTKSLIVHVPSTCENIRTFKARDARLRGLSRAEVSDSVISRFHSKYKKTQGCWLWQAGKYPRGYGMVHLSRDEYGVQRITYAHRVAYLLAHGDIRVGQVVMHSCDTPSCVNPAHLSLGSQGDNIRDGVSRGRYNVPHVNAQTVTDAQVAEIRRSSERGVILAKRLGVSTAFVSLVRRGLRRAA